MTARYGVAVVTTYFHPVLGGAETAALRLVRHLVARGHRVTVFTRRTSLDSPALETIEGAEVVRLGPIGPRRPSGKWAILPALVMALVERRADYRAVVCVDFRGIGLAALAARLCTGIPVVFQSATDGAVSAAAIVRGLERLGVSPSSPLTRAVTSPVRWLYGQADAFGCISRTIEREALDAGFPRERVHYMPNPLDLSRFTPATPTERAALRARLGLPADHRIVTFVGRLSLEKGLLELVDAWVALRPSRAMLLIVGPDMDGHEWNVGPAARERLAAANLSETARFTGGVSPQDVASWVRASDIAVHPSHFEAFGISAAESMAAGLAVIASDVAGYRDFVQSDVNAVVVPPHNSAAIAVALQRLLDDPALCERLGAAAAASVQPFEASRVLEDFAVMTDALVRT